MNIEYLRYFLDVARAKSITQAANMNFISPQGMSRAMRELEKELDCELLVRYSNRLRLSEQGERLVPYAKRVVDEFANFNAHALALGAEEEEEEDRTVQLLCQSICSFAFIPSKTLPKFFAADSHLQYREMENAEIYQLFKTEGSGLDEGAACKARVGVLALFDTKKPGAFTSIKLLGDRGFVYRPYLRTHDMVMISSDNPLANEEVLTREQVRQNPIVVSSTVLHDCVAERFGEESIKLTTSEFAMREKLVINDLAISFLPGIAKVLFDEDPRIRMVEFEDTYDVEIGFLGRAADLRSAPFAHFVDDLNAFYRAHEDPAIFELVVDDGE